MSNPDKHLHIIHDSHGLVTYDFEQMTCTHPDGEAELSVDDNGKIMVDDIYPGPHDYHCVQEAWEAYVNNTFEEVIEWVHLQQVN